ncbi:MAG: endonuclease V [Microthrixaceae bacterium]|nr:endonuclease V [Microthrixaceae bacterium]
MLPEPWAPPSTPLRVAAAFVAFKSPLGTPPPADAVMVDATGRDHPRRCGLALHLGHLLDLPSVGVTHRLLTDRDRLPHVQSRRHATNPSCAPATMNPWPPGCGHRPARGRWSHMRGGAPTPRQRSRS